MNTSKRYRTPPVAISYLVWQYYLWRAVDQDGEVVDALLQAHRDSWVHMLQLVICLTWGETWSGRNTIGI